MKTVTLQIGNSDDKLTQKEWAGFIGQVAELVADCAAESNGQIYFAGHSVATMPWQNAAWVFDLSAKQEWRFKSCIKSLRSAFVQDSVAFTVGKTRFI